jgi:hypothetical protein
MKENDKKKKHQDDEYPDEFGSPPQERNSPTYEKAHSRHEFDDGHNEPKQNHKKDEISYDHNFSDLNNGLKAQPDHSKTKPGVHNHDESPNPRAKTAHDNPMDHDSPLKENLGQYGHDEKGKSLIDDEYKRKMPHIGSLNTIGNKGSILQETVSKNNSGPGPSMNFDDKAGKKEQQFEISFADIQLQNSLSKDKLAMEKGLAKKGTNPQKSPEPAKAAGDRPMSGLKKTDDDNKNGGLAAKQPPKPDRHASSPFKKSAFNANNMSNREDSSNANSRPSGANRAPPPKAKKFYEKAEPEKITDLHSTSVFHKGILGAGAGRSVSTGEQRFKKKGHLRQMEDIMDNEHSHNVFRPSADGQKDSNGNPKLDLFFKRYAKLPGKQDRIDHGEIKAHSNHVKVAQLEAERIREDRRKRFVGEV